MKRRHLLLGGLATTLGEAVRAQAPDADTLIRNSQNLGKVSSSEAEVELENMDGAGKSRVRRIYTASRLKPGGSQDAMRLARFTHPADFKGTATLIHENAERDDDIWLYLPSVKRVKRILASGRKDRFLGTEFSYGDVVGYKAAEWSNLVTGEKAIGSDACFVVTSTPKSRDVAEAYGYTRRVTLVRKADFFPMEITLWNLDEVPAKRITSEEITAVGEGKLQAMKITAVNLIDHQKSILRFTNYKLGTALGKDQFKPEWLNEN